MTIIDHLRSKYLQHAQVLGDIEFQIYVLKQRRDELRKTMQTLDQSAPELKSLVDQTLQQERTLHEHQAKAKEKAKSVDSGVSNSAARASGPATDQGK